MNNLRTSSLALAVSVLTCLGASAGETKLPKASTPAPPEGECTPAPAGAPAAEAAKNTGPGRISTNVTVPKQTQGATFGEKVNQGLHAAGGSLAQGASTVGATVPGGAVISARCAKAPDPEPMATPAATDK